MNFDDIAIINVVRNFYKIHFWSMTKTKVVKSTTNADSGEKADDYFHEKR